MEFKKISDDFNVKFNKDVKHEMFTYKKEALKEKKEIEEKLDETIELNPEKFSHLCALMAWNGKSYEEARKFVIETEYDKLNDTTYANDSIETSKNGIKEMFGEKENIENTPENYAKVMDILEKIHDKWVESNAKKYKRNDFTKANRNLFQHLPLALIGLDETAKDLMFLAPFLKERKLETGDMQKEAWGAYKPNNEIKTAYRNYVKNFLETRRIKDEQDLTKWIRTVALNGGYKPLDKNASDMARNRVDYMNDNMGILVKNVLKNNTILADLLNNKNIEG